MRLHICAMNRTKWSTAVNGYGAQIQVRTCLVCNSLDTRDINYAQQVKANELNLAASGFNSDFAKKGG